MQWGLKSTMLVLALMALAIGVSACAKYPVVVGGPSASAPAPDPVR